MILEFGDGYGYDSLIAEGGVKSRDLRYMGVDIEISGGVGVIGMQLNLTAIPTSLFILKNILHSLVSIFFLCN